MSSDDIRWQNQYRLLRVPFQNLPVLGAKGLRLMRQMRAYAVMQVRFVAETRDVNRVHSFTE